MPQRAREAFFAAREDGSEVFVPAGRVIGDDDPLVVGRESLFEPEPPVEPEPPKRTRKTA